MSEEKELKRALWAAHDEIRRMGEENKRLAQQVADQNGSISRTREAIRKACNRLAGPYDHLCDGLWVGKLLGLQDLVENIVWDLLRQRGNVQRLRAEIESLTQQVEDERGRTAKALGEAAVQAIAFQTYYREANRQKGGE
jgi:hypothetical protein